jgi:hypothetical protein
MKAYIVTTGAASGLLAVAHVARIVEEGVRLIAEPIFLVTTLASVGICAWAIILIRRYRRPAS